MAITKLAAIPTAGQRIGGGSVRLEPLATATAYFITPNASNVPDMGDGDWLIFGRGDYISGSSTADPNFLCIGTSTSNHELRVQLSTTSSWLAFLWADAGVNWTGTASFSGAYARMGGAVYWFLLRTGDTMQAGFYDERAGAIVKTALIAKPGSHNGRWSGDLVDAGTAGAARMVIGARYVSSAAGTIRALHSGHITFCKCPAGVTLATTGIDPSDGGFDALIASIMADPQRVNEYTWHATNGVTTFGDVTRGATGTAVGNRFPERLWDGDRITCPRTGKYLSLTGSSLDSAGAAVGSKNDAWVYPPYTQPAANPQQGQQKDATPIADKLSTGAYAFLEMPRLTNSGPEHLIGFINPTTGLPCKWPVVATAKFKRFVSSTGAEQADHPHLENSNSVSFPLDNHHGGALVERDGDIVFMPSFHSEISASGFNSVAGERAAAFVQYSSVVDDTARAAVDFIDISTTYAEPFGSNYTGNEEDYERWCTSYAALGRFTDSGGTTWAIGCERHRDTAPGWLGAWQYNGLATPYFVKVTVDSASGDVKGGIPIGVVPLDSEHCLLAWNPRPVISASRGSVGAMGFVFKPGSTFQNNTSWFAPYSGDACDGASGRPTLGSIEPGDERFIIDPQNRDALVADDLTIGETVGTYRIIGYGGKIAMCSTVFSAGSLDDDAADAYDNPTSAKIHVQTWNPSTKTLGGTVTVDITDELLLERGDSGAPPWMTLQFTDAERKGAVLLFPSGTSQQVSGTDFSYFTGLWGSRVSGFYWPDIKGSPDKFVSLGTIYDCTVSGGLSVTALSLGRCDDWSDKALIQVHGRVTSSTLGSVGTSLIDLASRIAVVTQAGVGSGTGNFWLGPNPLNR